MTSTGAMAQITMRMVVEGIQRDIQAQIEQTHADALQREQEAQRRIEEISTQLQTLTNQLNKFRPVSENAVGVVQDKVTEQLQQKFDAQNERMGQLSATVVESRKEAQTNAEVLQNLLVGIENLGANFKHMQEKMVTWQTSYQNAEEEYHCMNEEILQEIPLSAPANVRPEHAVNPPVFSSPLVSTAQNAVPTSVNLPSSSGQLSWFPSKHMYQ